MVLNVATGMAPKELIYDKPWGLQRDGDVWEAFFEAILVKGPETNHLTKVKGHADEDDMKEGNATRKDQQGNDKADEAATEGLEILNGGGSRALRAIAWIADRHDQCCLFMGRTHKVIQK